MKCEKCNLAEATFYYKSDINGVQTEHHMCTACAKEHGLYDSMMKMPALMADRLPLMQFLDQTPSMHRMLSGFSNFPSGFFMQPFAIPVFTAAPVDAAPVPTEESAAKIPEDAGEDIRKKRQIAALRHQMDTAIKAENFEEAARIRDEIHKMQ